MCKIYCLSRLKKKGYWNDGATSFRPRPHETRHFWNRIFFYPDSCGRARLTALESGFKTMRFRWADSLVSCERKVDSCFKVCGSKNIRIRVNVAFKIQPFTLFLVLKSDIFFTGNKQLFRFLLASQSNKMSHSSLLSHNGPTNRKNARKSAKRKAQWLYLFCYLKIL